MRHRQARRLLLGLCLLLVIMATAQAQELSSTPIGLDNLVSGRLDGRTPRAAYHFDGLRGEVIRLRLLAISGDLDPVLAVFDDTGALVFGHDDKRGPVSVDDTLTLDRSGRYTLLVGRFGYELGTTAGDYELSTERAGVLSEQGSALRYGDAVMSQITNTQPQVYFTVQASQGDILNIEMLRSSGSLDPYLQIVDSSATVVADNDDAPGGQTHNARIEGLLIEADDTYIIIASRYGGAAGSSVGSFVLRLDQANNSGVGNSAMAPRRIDDGDTAEGALDDAQPEQFYSFRAQASDLVTISMDRLSGNLDAYLILARANLEPLVEDDDGGSGQNARIDSYRIPESGLYTIIAGRFEREAGTSSGSYRLSFDNAGSAFTGLLPGIATIEYGQSISGVISDDAPEIVYAFYASTGDVIDVTLNRADGDLDPVLELLNSQQGRILRDDDSGGDQNARITSYTVTSDGIYYIRTTRYDGASGNRGTSGQYILSLIGRTANE